MESRWWRIFLTVSSLRLWVLCSESCVASATYSRPDPGAWAHQPWAEIPELFERFLDSESDDTEHSSKESKLCEILNVSVIILPSSKHFINRVRKENILMKKVFTSLVFWSGHVDICNQKKKIRSSGPFSLRTDITRSRLVEIWDGLLHFQQI